MTQFRFVSLLLLLAAAIAGTASAQFSLTTTFAGGSTAQPGQMFDLTTSAANVTIDRFDCHTTVAVGSAVTYQIYYKMGTYVGSEQLSGNWTLHDTVATVSGGQGSPTVVVLNTPLMLNAGTTYGMYVTTTLSLNGIYTTGANTYSDANLTITTGTANGYPFGSVFQPRTWNGTIYYSVGSADNTLLTNNAFNGTIDPSQTDRVAMRMTANTYGNNYNLNSVTFTQIGTMPDGDITAVKLFRDNNTNGEVDAGDTQLGSGTLTGGTVTFSGSPLQALTAGSPVALLLAVDTGSTLTPGETIRFQITSASNLTWSGGTDLTSFPVTGGTLTHVIPSSVPEALYFKFDEGSGTVAANTAAPGRGTSSPAFSGAANWVTSGNPIGGAGAALGTGTSGTGKIMTGWNVSQDLVPTQSWTMETWFRSGNSTHYLCGGNTSNWRVYFFSGRISMRGGGLATTDSNIASLNDGQWHHFAFVYDAPSNTTYMYIDGQLDRTMTGQTTSIPDTDFQIGGYTSSATAYNWYGDVDDFRFWLSARSQAEIQAHMNVQLPLQDSVSITGSSNRGSASPGATSFAALSVNANTFVNNNDLNSITINRAGTAVDSDFSNITLYRDNNNDGLIDGGDTVLGTGTLTGGQVVFSGSPLQALTTSSARRLLLGVDLASTMTPGTTFSFSVTAASFTGGTDLTGYPVNGTTVTMRDPVMPFHIYYRMNEGAGNQTANSAVPGSGFGTVNLSSTAAPNWVTPGQLGAAALDFDTVSGSGLDTGWTDGLPTNEDWTIETWLRRHGTTAGYAFRFAGGFTLYYTSTNGLHLLASGISATSNILITTAAANVWQHVALVYSAATQEISVYVDGNLDSVNSTTALATGLLVVGSFSTTSTRWTGDLDEFRVWDVARSPAEIQAGMLSELPIIDSMLLTSSSAAGGVISGPTSDFVVADLTAATFVNTNHINSLTFTKNSTVADNDIGTLVLYLDNNDNGVVDVGTDTVLGSGTLTSGEITFSGGPLVAQTVGTPTRLLLAMNTTTGIGAGESVEFTIDSASDVVWNGTGSDLTTYPLSGGTWVVSDPNMPFMLYYKFNEGTGTTTANDAVPGVGHPNPSLPPVPPTWVAPGRLGAAALDFGATGVVHGIDSGYTGGLPMNDSWTIETWLTLDTAAVGHAFRFGTNSFRMSRQASGQLELLSTGGTPNTSMVVLASPPIGTWFHVAVVYDHTQPRVTIYVNGLQVATDARTAEATGVLSVGGFYTPATSGSATTAWKGRMDEFRMWNVARTQTEILAGMNTELPPVPSYGFAGLTPATGSTLAGANDFVVMDVGVGAIVDPHNLNSVTFTKTGSLADAHLTNIRLVRDEDNNGVLSTGDTQLGTGTLSGGQVTFSGSPLQALAAGASARLLLVADIAAAAPALNNFEFAITSTTSSSWSGGGADISAYPITGGSVVIEPPPLSGTYTINQTNGDFTDIGQAFDILELVGVSGPVILEITDSATYVSNPSYSLGIDDAVQPVRAPIAGISNVNRVTLRAAAGQTPVVQGNANGAILGRTSATGTVVLTGRGGIAIMESFVSVEGLTVTGGPNFGIYIQGNGTTAGTALQPHGVEIRRCFVHDIPDGPGIAYAGQNSAYGVDVIIENNFVWNCFMTSIPATSVIQGSTNGPGCIFLRNADFTTIVRHNTVLNSTTVANTAAIASTNASVGRDWTCENNIFVSPNASTYVVRFGAAANQPSIAGTNLNCWFGPNFGGTGTGAAPTTTFSFTDWQAGGRDPNGLNTDPLLLDTNPASADLSLDGFSPCIDPAGQTSTMAIDIFGNTRPIGTAVDIGAHERASAPRPEMQVSRSGSIPSGSVDGLGNVSVVGDSFTWTITNVGPGDLVITTPITLIPGTGNPSINTTTQPSTTVTASGGTTTFTIAVTPALNAFGFTIQIANNDINNNPYQIFVTGTGFMPNGPAEANPAAGSIFSGAVNGPFTTAIVPGGTLANATIELTDPEADNITVTAITPVTATPTGITAPAIPGAPAHPVTLAWTGTADASNTPGDYTWEVTFEDAGNGTPVTVEVTITIGDLPPTHAIANALGGNGTVGTPYTINYTVGMTGTNDVDLATVTDPNVGQTLAITNVTLGGSNPRSGAFSLTLAGGFLNIAPNGSLLNVDVGVHTFDVEISDGTNDINIHVSATVAAAPVISTTSPLPTGEQGQNYLPVNIVATGGTGTLTFAVSAGSLPPGITLSATGVVAGLPSLAGTYNFTVTATDTLGIAAQQAFAITIDPPAAGTPTITTLTLPTGVTNTAYGPVTLQVNGGLAPYAFSIASGNLPTGVTMSAAGVISGTPTTQQIANFEVTVTDSAFASSSANLSITVNGPAPGSGGGGGGGGGCAASNSNSNMWGLLLGALALLGVVLRVRAVRD